MPVTAKRARELALSLENASSYPHFDRVAFKVARIYVTLAADGRTANFKFAPDEQELKCITVPDAFSPIPNAWGRQGWTTAQLDALSVKELAHALETAWRHGKGASPKRSSRKRQPPR